MKVFSKEKFLSLPKQQQHKKACELVRVLYDSILADKEYEGLGGEYDAMASWLGEESLKEFTLEAIADRYHYHCKKGQVYHKEHNLLPRRVVHHGMVVPCSWLFSFGRYIRPRSRLAIPFPGPGTEGTLGLTAVAFINIPSR